MHLRLIPIILQCVVMGTLAPANAAHRYASPPEHNLRNTPGKWGPYTITIEGTDFVFRICVRDQHHNIVKEVDCGESSAIYTQQLNSTGTPDLLIVAWNGSNLYSGHTTYIFAQDSGIRNVAIIQGGEGHFQRLNGHGLQFVMEYSGVLDFACNVCHGCEPNMPLVLNWNHGRLIDATRQYPALSKAQAASYRQEFLDQCGSWSPDSTGQSVISPAAGYYANEYELGHGRKAYRWLMDRLPTQRTRSWFVYCAKIVRYQISQIRHMSTVNQAKVLSTSQANIFQHPPVYPRMYSLSD